MSSAVSFVRPLWFNNDEITDGIFRSVANMGEKYKRGVPSLGLPSLDPMSMPKIEIQMGNNKVKMEDITSSGFIQPIPKIEFFLLWN